MGIDVEAHDGSRWSTRRRSSAFPPRARGGRRWRVRPRRRVVVVGDALRPCRRRRRRRGGPVRRLGGLQRRVRVGLGDGGRRFRRRRCFAVFAPRGRSACAIPAAAAARMSLAAGDAGAAFAAPDACAASSKLAPVRAARAWSATQCRDERRPVHKSTSEIEQAARRWRGHWHQTTCPGKDATNADASCANRAAALSTTDSMALRLAVSIHISLRLREGPRGRRLLFRGCERLARSLEDALGGTPVDPQRLDRGRRVP